MLRNRKIAPTPNGTTVFQVSLCTVLSHMGVPFFLLRSQVKKKAEMNAAAKVMTAIQTRSWNKFKEAKLSSSIYLPYSTTPPRTW